MDFVRDPALSLAVLALLVAALQIYLILNKLWIRKHEPAVAGSISIVGETLGLVPLVLLSASFLMEGYWPGAVDGIMWIAAGAVTIAVGSGRWVEGNRRRSFLGLVRDAVRVERDEVSELARSLVRPRSAARILEILQQIAVIDQELDDRERAFIETFADAWSIELDWDAWQAGADEVRSVDFIRVRRAVEEYLATSPPPSQVSQLGDIVSGLVAIDQETSSGEELILEELLGMFAEYVDRDGTTLGYGVAIVPQDPEQDRAIGTILPGLEKSRIEGGTAYVLGPFHSERYADLVGGEYRALNFFTTVVRAPIGDVARPAGRALA